MSFSACHNCEERHVGCHSTCERYLEERRKADELKEKINKQRNANSEIEQFRKTAISKIRKRIRR